jgi:hypothetical protein
LQELQNRAAVQVEIFLVDSRSNVRIPAATAGPYSANPELLQLLNSYFFGLSFFIGSLLMCDASGFHG